MKQAVCYPLLCVAIALLGLSGCLEIPGSEVINSSQGEHLVERCQRIPLSKGFSGGVPAEFELLVWNIHKQQHVSWQPELTRLAANSDLLLLQEAMNTDELVRWFAAQGWQWQQSVAFRYEEHSAGVLTAAKTSDVYACAIRVPEPAIRIPKSSLVTLFPRQGSSYPLLVINIHAINFELGIAAYKQQVNSLLAMSRHYPGPVIVAGDFNTWSEKRQLLVTTLLHQYKFNEVSFSPDVRTRVFSQPLDHLFYRGLSVAQSEAIPSSGSDHVPLRIRFTL